MTKIPPELRDYILCKKLGWTITELYEQPARLVDIFLDIMSIESQQERLQSNG
jgi:hypothetical protein